jgi:hypothetical protein
MLKYAQRDVFANLSSDDYQKFIDHFKDFLKRNREKI